MFIVTKKIDSENISRVCRTCLREDNDKMICLFIGPPESSLGAKLQSLSCLEVAQGDGLPEKMCDRCVMRAESALLFREQCRAADQALRQAAVQVSKDKAELEFAKSYHQNQSYLPLQYSQNPSRFPDYHPYSNYQDFYVQNQFHSPIYPREEQTSQHMHVIESHNTYLSLGGYNSSSFVNNDFYTDRTYPLFRPDDFNSYIRHDQVHAPTSCALQCSICNYTFNNETQLAYHSNTHNPANVELPNDEIHIEVEESSNTDRNLHYEKADHMAVDNSKLNSNFTNQFQNITQEPYVNQNHKIDGNIINTSSLENGVPNPLVSEIIINNQNSQIYSNGIDLSSQGKGVNNSSVSEIIINNQNNEIDDNIINLSSQEKGVNNSSVSDISVNNLNNETNGDIINLSSQKKNFNNSLVSEIIRNNKFKCEICSRLFSQKSKLEAHQIIHSRKKPFECANCSKSYSSKSKLAAHTRLHTQVNIHKCDICQKIFSYPSYLIEHLKTHNPESQDKRVRFDCAECKKQFYTAKGYKKHRKFHTGKGLFQCDICDKIFTHKYPLKVHMSSHELSKSHKCELCDKSFNQKSNLVEHMRIHTKVKPFKCKICDKSFSQSSHLKSHELSHNSIRKFLCKICGKGFKLSSHLKRHVNLHTGIKMYKCDQCDQTFSQAFSLKRHSKKHAE